MFSENQAGYNPHDDLAPETSAKIITQHPKDGVEMGRVHGLPNVILDVIQGASWDKPCEVFLF